MVAHVLHEICYYVARIIINTNSAHVKTFERGRVEKFWSERLIQYQQLETRWIIVRILPQLNKSLGKDTFNLGQNSAYSRISS